MFPNSTITTSPTGRSRRSCYLQVGGVGRQTSRRLSKVLQDIILPNITEYNKYYTVLQLQSSSILPNIILPILLNITVVVSNINITYILPPARAATLSGWYQCRWARCDRCRCSIMITQTNFNVFQKR